MDAITPDKAEEARHPAPFDAVVLIRLKERAVFPDGLEILYACSSHKRPMVGGPTCAKAHLKLTRAGVTEAIELRWDTSSSGKDSWETKIWHGYAIELAGLDYDREVRVRVRPV